MAEDTSSDQVSEGFNLVLDQLPNARENLVKELTAALHLVLRALVGLSNWGYFKRGHNRCLRTAIHA